MLSLPWRRPWRAVFCLAFATTLNGAASAQTPPAPADATLPPVSASGQRIFESTRAQLLQVRTLLREQDSQATVGSGFLVDAQGLAITNYHVVSQYALRPSAYRLSYTMAEGRSGALQLLSFDVVHDLALVRVLPPGEAPAEAPSMGASAASAATAATPVATPAATPAASPVAAPATARAAAPVAITPLAFRAAARPLSKGERIYSLGNPLDVGFAVVEGIFNGLIERSYLPQIFFGGSLNPGMSGGPAVDQAGNVIGINVATRLDGQQVSFLVPAEHAVALLARGRTAQPITQAVYAEVTRQLTVHQAGLVDRFVGMPWRSANHARYRVPVPQETFMRCWGSTSPAEAKFLEFERSDCTMDQAVYVTGSLLTGAITVRHEAYDGSKLGSLRFARVYTESFRNEHFFSGRSATAPQCKERTVDRNGLALRAVVCLSALKRFEGLFNLSVLATSVDHATQGVQGRLDARGVDFAGAMKLTEHYLQGFAWTQARPAAKAATK